MSKKISYIFLLLLVFSCRNKPATPHAAITTATGQTTTPVTIIIQPFAGMPETETKTVAAEMTKVYPHIIVKPSIPLPGNAFYAPRNRYRADSLINFLGRQTPAGFVTMGLTHRDISTTKDAVADWGVMGLGFCPGNACIASTFRISKSYKAEQLFKVAIHELGHTQGLPHCPEKTCFMRDAEGHNPTDEEKEFCTKCKALLITKGWQL